MIGAYATLVEALDRAPADRPFVTMYREGAIAEAVTFGAFRGRAAAIGELLRQQGADAGDTVIVILRQGVDLIAAFAGAMAIGAIPTILAYPHRKVEPAKYRAGLAGVTANLKAALILLDPEFPAELTDELRRAGVGQCVTCPADGAERPWVPVPCEAAALAFIQHSAGTTGLQKAVGLTHAAVLTQLRHLAAALTITCEDRIYSWLPLYHDMGLIACFMLPLAWHVEVVMQDPLEWVMQPASMMEIITRERCTISWLPNFGFQFLARRVTPEERENLDLRCVRALTSCSEPVRAASLDEFVAAYMPHGLRPEAVQTSYAMAENVFAVTQSLPGEPPRRLETDADAFRTTGRAIPPSASRGLPLVSSGRCLPGSTVRVVSERGATVADGFVGEILIRSDSLFAGYLNRPDLTAEAFVDGWYRSGDLGFVLEGELYVVGRSKDLIIVGGKNIHPQDVEEIACAHPAIHDGRAVALGVYNPDLGTEDIVLVAELDDGAADDAAPAIARAISREVAAELGVSVRAVYLKPARWIVKSTAGKPARRDTRAKLLREHPDLAAAGLAEPSS